MKREILLALGLFTFIYFLSSLNFSRYGVLIFANEVAGKLNSDGQSQQQFNKSETFNSSMNSEGVTSEPTILVRVLLSDGVPLFEITSSGMISVTNEEGKHLGEWSPPIKVFFQSGTINLTSTGMSASSSYFKCEPTLGNVLSHRGISYNGDFILQVWRGKPLLINRVGLEEYTASVVTAEMPALWHEEALKAQAVAARTYALQRLLVNADKPFDVYATVADQLYQGLKSVHLRGLKATSDTRGKIIAFNGEPIIAYYHSASGGKTRQGSLPYLVSVDSPENSPFNSWEVEFSIKDIQEKVQASLPELGDVYDIQPVLLSPMEVKVIAIGKKGKKELNSVALRNILGVNVIRSPNYIVEVSGFLPGEDFREIHDWMRVSVISANSEKDIKVRRATVTSGLLTRPMYHRYYAAKLKEIPDRLLFKGSGYGHGLGMSQWGAKKMAEEGRSWEEIIKHYFNGVEVVNISDLNYRSKVLHQFN